ncbi:HNH endonuclease [Mangrovimicrobium sediminis]|uniref:HNH endonuclease n=1 Tax=Mangrovimicrobium sediminis TaxID=2562682 RepID=A0A4Z0LY60_9GAMM|nr:HNH endonuclease signature motif containing protein [Haliea sp. SAOS-164]TGD72211.1 HNH endonuclease [Haliea sp. SAOS-164]
MKIKSDFNDLWASAKRMGEYRVVFDIKVNYSGFEDVDNGLSSSEGYEVDIGDIDVQKGVLSYEGRQVLLFIPDQGSNIDDVLSGKAEGKKFHVADCRTLDSMRRQKRFSRYKATYNISGKFQVYGVSFPQRVERKGEAGLKVCKNCLMYLNYRGYRSGSGSEKTNVYSNFDIAEFLSTYSTLFKSMPDRDGFEEAGTYSDDWSVVSTRYRESVSYRCESCSVDLTSEPGLLHTHHISGNKRENHSANLKALCLDCHRKQPKHGYMRITHDQMGVINKLRKAQGLLHSSSGWEGVIRIADKALDGLLRYYASRGLATPEVGYELANANDEVVAELEVAWPESRRGIAIDEAHLQAARELGWNVLTVGDALKSMNG